MIISAKFEGSRLNYTKNQFRVNLEYLEDRGARSALSRSIGQTFNM